MARNIKVIGPATPQAGTQGSDRSDRVPAAVAGSPVTNRGPSTSHTPENETGGIDTITISLFGEFVKPEHSFRWLSEGQQAAAKDRRSKPDEEADLIHFPYGGKFVGQNARWQVTFKGLHFMIAEREDSTVGVRPSMQVQIHSRDLLLHGYAGCIKLAYEFCCMLNFRVVGEKVNRLDVCVDVFIPVHEFALGFFQRKYITRARKWSMFGSMDDENTVTQTLNFGGGGSAIKCRIYDKVAETQRNAVKTQLMLARRWQNEMPEHATRVEFQLTGQALRDNFNIRELRTVEEKIGQIVRFLTTEWLKFIPEQNDGKHYERKEPNDSWLRVQKAFERWAGRDLRKRDRPVKLIPNLKTLVVGMFGYASSYYASRGTIPISSDDFLNELKNAVRGRWNEFVLEVQHKRNMWAAKTGIDTFAKHRLEHPAWTV